ncbi:MAG: hypothetical protein JSV89_01325 [Spirochaetaceae bacterium]|nr:MAG: hypothetical protein JSV89_01325 [Spirochaetaceae bacterium]
MDPKSEDNNTAATTVLYLRGLDEQLVKRFKLLCSIRGESLKDSVSRLISSELDQADLRQEFRQFMEGETT